jgi:hypothetical protein
MASSPSYFAPLVAELKMRTPTGRVELPPLADYWDSVYVAEATPIGRGWLRQVDVDRNPVFFDGSLTPERYREWLVDNGVQYVALADRPTSWVGSGEAAVVRTGPAYLRQVWSSSHWTLYEVDGSPSIVDSRGSGAAHLVHQTGDELTIAVDSPGEVLVRVGFSRWLTVRGPSGCLRPSGRWTELEATRPGVYRISSALFANSRHRC